MIYKFQISTFFRKVNCRFFYKLTLKYFVSFKFFSINRSGWKVRRTVF
ncbi:hypothetical protein LEP1GSC132_0519 [Leptospira kirschneri str. 200803703]|uniref:Uncharacterized protein n=1 Tax=Leptospira kirschneri str. 200802841 TaxID=1193047 RepID=A0A828XWV2_9LEPT|nr:hypothetical protein LEP1GSC131_0121 [Leptospira kirschneri str. 200802841]EKO59901.1 hypothetical protein LEP1GSC082_0029 [Leptospira kirschneri str. H2]EKP07048.1 hypothetical protein LEP1GSC018_1243 [Leptospira kirschneri str. 2008720114]EMK11052.1 hypothetical protein LEP1GSC166_1412 [Leptospira kirschneri]EMK15459.1 hypothetical protein LEP1GSC042_2112 [Leptospira kirschneri serovar Bim str. PUO 1247]EMN06040.1 hypothetical protein LEP1GSC046_0257 [Leptospira kirschneri serovar Bim str